MDGQSVLVVLDLLRDLKDSVSLIDAHAQLDTFFRFYFDLRPHRPHAGATPSQVYQQTQVAIANA